MPRVLLIQCVAGVIQQTGQYLRDLPAVAHDGRQVVGQVYLEGDLIVCERVTRR